MSARKVCIIGGGASGIIALRQLLSFGRNLRPVLFEQQSSLGGTWKYEPIFDENGILRENIHSSMYDSLHTNLPKEVMQLSNFAFPEELDSHPHHSDILNYLNSVVSLNKLENYIKFNHKVVSVVYEKTSAQWNVEILISDTQKHQTAKRQIFVFDSVVICNGHYTVPFYPDLNGLSELPTDKVIHSHHYRNPGVFHGDDILVIGSGFSAYDIATECAQYGLDVTISTKNGAGKDQLQRVCSRIQNSGREEAWTKVTERFTISSLSTSLQTGKIVVNFEEGNPCEVDCIIVCTGYAYSFPFLTNVQYVEHKCIAPLFEHIFHADYPDGSLTFLGIPWRVIPFPLVEVQSTLLAYVLSGEVTLPSSKEMNEWCRTLLEQQTELRFTHKLDHSAYLEHLQERYFPRRIYKFSTDRSVRRIAE